MHADPSEPGRVYRPTLSVAASAGAFVQQLAAAAAGCPRCPARKAWLVIAARADYEAWQVPQETPGPLEDGTGDRASVAEFCPEDAIVTNGAGNYSAWLHRYYRYKTWRSQLGPTSGSMGYGLPAAVAAKLQHPDREVICLAGDGCFQMTMQEFGTAAQYGAKIIVLISNNAMYGTIRMHQERHYPGRPSGTDIVNPDFAALAAAYGGLWRAVTECADFPAAPWRGPGTPACRPGSGVLKVSHLSAR